MRHIHGPTPGRSFGAFLVLRLKLPQGGFQKREAAVANNIGYSVTTCESENRFGRADGLKIHEPIELGAMKKANIPRGSAPTRERLEASHRTETRGHPTL